MRKSHASDNSKPTPKQKPRLAAITGLEHRAGDARFQSSCDTCSGEASRKPLMSPPLEKCSPFARTTITRTRASSSRASKTARNCSRACIEMTLNVGRRRMMSARSRCASISTEKPSRSCSSVWPRWLRSLIVLLLGGFCRLRGLRFRIGRVLARLQLGAQNIADRRLRDVVDEDVIARALEVDEVGLAAPCIERVGIDVLAALDECNHALAPALVLD